MGTASTPMGSMTAPVMEIEDDGETLTASFDDGNGGGPRPVAWQAPEATRGDFIWLVRCCAAFHSINVIGVLE